jgi:hypothetical protein
VAREGGDGGCVGFFEAVVVGGFEYIGEGGEGCVGEERWVVVLVLGGGRSGGRRGRGFGFGLGFGLFGGFGRCDFVVRWYAF